MKITQQALATAQDETGDPWAVSDGILYKLCRDHPLHVKAQEVSAKVLLIGRSYAAALERGRSAASTAGSSNEIFYTRDVPRVLGASDLDRRIKALRSRRRVTHHSLSLVLNTHEYLCGRFNELTGKTKRSLASKYLHFHVPNLFFLFDTRARQGLGAMELPQPTARSMTGKGDLEYSRFVVGALRLRDRIERDFSVVLTPRQLDRLLIAASGEHDR